MKKYVKSAKTPRRSPVDLSEEYNIGLEAVAELRKTYPQIPAKPRYRRSHAWIGNWHIEFDLGINVDAAAQQYFETGVDALGVLDYAYKEIKFDIDYCFAFCEKCENLLGIVDSRGYTVEGGPFYNDRVQCGVSCFDDNKFGGSTVLTVYSGTKIWGRP